MPAGDEFLSAAGDMRNAAAGLALLGAGANVYDAFSAVMSSPWSTEKFTNSPEEEAMAREYVLHALVISGVYCAAAGWLIRSWWPILGGAGVAGYMYWLYGRALKRSTNGMQADPAAAPAPASAAAPAPAPVFSTPWAP